MKISEHARWPLLQERIRLARTAVQPKRARFARHIGVNDSTLAVLEGSRPGPVSSDMIDFVTAKLGWHEGLWQDVLHGRERKYGPAITLTPTSFKDIAELAKHLRDGADVVLDVSELDSPGQGRVLDAAAGIAFGLRGKVQRLGSYRFIISQWNADDSPAGDAADLGQLLGAARESLAPKGNPGVNAANRNAELGDRIPPENEPPA